MESDRTWLDAVRSTFSDLLTDVAAILPSLLLAALVLVAGWLLARASRSLVGKLSQGVNRLLDRLFQRGQLSGARLSSTATSVLGEIVFWLLVVITVLLATGVAGVGAFLPWLEQLIAHLPQLIVGLAILLAGFIVSILVRERVLLSVRGADLTGGETVGRLAQLAVLFVALVFGFDQLGLEVTLLIVLTAVTLAALLAGLLFAFGLGARDFVSNLIAARSARSALSAGLHVRIGELEGQVLDITATQISLDTPEGKLLVPASIAEREPILIITGTTDASADHG